MYGALVVDGCDRRLLTASPASPTVAQLLRGATDDAGENVTVRDVEPLDHDAPRGATINLLFLPLIRVCFTAVLALGALRLSARALIGAVSLVADARRPGRGRAPRRWARLAQPLLVLGSYVVAGGLLMLAADAWRRARDRAGVDAAPIELRGTTDAVEDRAA